MTLQSQVSKDEHGVVRLYQVALHEVDAQALTAADVQQALNVVFLDSDFIEIFNVRDLQDIGLRGYMETGLGIASRDIDPFAERIVDVDGWVVVVLSQAFGGFGVTLSPKHPLRPIGAFVEEGATSPLIDLDAETAHPKAVSTPEPAPTKKRSDAAMSGMIATIVLVVLAALVWVMISVGG